MFRFPPKIWRWKLSSWWFGRSRWVVTSWPWLCAVYSGDFYFPVLWFWNLSSAIRRIPKKKSISISWVHVQGSTVGVAKNMWVPKKNAGTWSDDIDHWILWAGWCFGQVQVHEIMAKTFFHLHSFFFHAPNKGNPLQKHMEKHMWSWNQGKIRLSE